MLRTSLATLLLVGVAYPAAAQTTQTDDTFHGRHFLWVEAETAQLSADPDGNGFLIVSTTTPITSTQGLDILPADSNVSGTALFDQPGGGQQTDTATLLMEFSVPGTYQLYTRHSLYDWDGNGNYGGEDSFFLSPAFDHNSSADWVGFEGLWFDVSIADPPNPGYALDPKGWVPTTADSSNEGWYALRDWGVKSEGVVQFPITPASGVWNGYFTWYNRPAFVDSDAGGGYVGNYGFKTEYIVTPGQVGQTLSFEISTREPYVALDGVLFIQDDEVNLLDLHSQEAVTACVIGGGCDLFIDGFETGNTSAWSATSP